jgi:hypothetical protein
MFVSIVSYRIDATYLQEDKALDERDSIGQTDKELERPHRKALTSERCPKTKVQVHICAKSADFTNLWSYNG